MTDARFHFTSSAPSAQLLSDVQSLNAWPLESVSAFASVVVLYLGRRVEAAESLEQFVAATPAVKSRARPLLTTLLHFFSATMRTGGVGPEAATRAEADLVALGLESGRASALASQFGSSLSTLAATAAAETLHVNQLHDISWKFGVSAASSEQAQMGATFLQLQLVVERGHGKENVLMGPPHKRTHTRAACTTMRNKRSIDTFACVHVRATTSLSEVLMISSCAFLASSLLLLQSCRCLSFTSSSSRCSSRTDRCRRSSNESRPTRRPNHPGAHSGTADRRR